MASLSSEIVIGTKRKITVFSFVGTFSFFCQMVSYFGTHAGGHMRRCWRAPGWNTISGRRR